MTVPRLRFQQTALWVWWLQCQHTLDEAQRQATKDAAQLAGLNALRLLNEPTAAAMAYGLEQHEKDAHYLIYDLGGGTFDVSVLKLNHGVYEVLATGGNSTGGDDIDRLIANWLIKQTGVEPSQADNHDKQRLNQLQKTTNNNLVIYQRLL